jgi:aminopeptidase N
MPTYDIHLAAYEDWKVHVARAASGVPIVTYTYPSHAGAQAAIYGDLPKALDFYERAFGRYRWGTASFLEEPIFGGAMEHASVVSMDEALFRTPTEARTAAFHELAHHFCGNLVRVRTWNDFWLSEGLAEYLTARFVAANDGPAAEAKVYRGYLAQALAADRRAPHPVRPPDPELDVLTIFDAISYQKGALVLRALGRVVGEARLTDFVRGWFERHTFGAVTTRDLERELTAGTGADLRAFFEGFVYGSYHPEVRVSFRAVADGETELEVEQVQASGPRDGFAFPLDVDLIDDAGRAERFTLDVTRRRTTRRVRAARPPRSLLVDPEEYLLGTVVCAAAESPCKEGFRCAEAGGAASPGGAVSPRVCVPR